MTVMAMKLHDSLLSPRLRYSKKPSFPLLREAQYGVRSVPVLLTTSGCHGRSSVVVYGDPAILPHFTTCIW